MKKELYRQDNPVVNDAFDRLAVNIHLKATRRIENISFADVNQVLVQQQLV